MAPRLAPGHARFSVAPHYARLPDGAPVITLSKVRGVLTDIAGNSKTVEAEFQNGVAVLVFDVAFSGSTATYTLDLTGFDDKGIEAYHATQQITLKPGDNPDVAAPVLVPAGPDASLKSITVSPASVTLNAGATSQLSVSAVNTSGQPTTPNHVAWSSSNGAIATVDDNGGITAGASQGSAWIVAKTITGLADSAKIIVHAPVAKVVVAPATLQLVRGDSGAVGAELRDAGGNVIDDRTATWSSSDASVATVAANGVVKALKIGSATITASAEGKTGTAAVTVVSPIDHVEIAPASLSMSSLHETQSVKATVVARQGASVAGIPLTYSSSNSAVASVDANGVVTANANGSATITATAETFTATANVTVQQVATTIAISPKSAGVNSIGDSRSFSATASDALGNAMAIPFTWTSSDESVAKVDQTGVATAVKGGTATITASIGAKSASATFSVIPVPRSIFVRTDTSQIKVGSATNAHASFADGNGNPIADVSPTWSTSTPSIISISSDGRIVGLSGGLGKITASAGSLTGTTTITVLGGGGPLTLNVTTVEKLPRGTQQFSVTAGGSGPFTWYVNEIAGGNATYGTIDNAGLYTAPASVPSPATFNVCAKQASPAAQGCAQVTIKTIPTSGSDVIVFNDIDTFESGSSDPNDQQMYRNLVDYTATGARTTQHGVMFYSGHGSRNPYQLFTMRQTIANAGYTIDDISADFTSPIDPKYKVVVLLLPTVPFTVSEINNLKQFSADGGRIVFIGEWDGYYTPAGISTENSFFQSMGAQMTNTGGAFDCGSVTEPASSLRPHEVTTGLTQFTLGCASEVIPGPNDYAFLYSFDGTHVLGAAAKVDVTPIVTTRIPLTRPTLSRSPRSAPTRTTTVTRDPNDTQGRPIGHP